MSRISNAVIGLAILATLGACSSDNGGGSPTTLSVAKTATNSGDNQSGTAGVALAESAACSGG